jgi:nucleotide-binding universal stress UspA family protein
MSQTIVVPLVGAQSGPENVSEQALPMARSLARKNNAAVVLMSVVDIANASAAEDGERSRGPIDLPALAWHRPGVRREDRDVLIAGQLAYLDRFVPTFDGDVVTRVETGEPARMIVHVAESVEEPIIVMASHGRAGVRRLVQGSVAFQVVRAAFCPVLIVAHSLNEWVSAEEPAIDRVLIPLDGTYLSEYILEAGLAALGPATTSLHLLRVIDPESSPSSLNVIDFIEEASTEAEDYIDDIAQLLTEIGYDVSCEVRTGSPEEEILAAGVEYRADLIAMATHAREGISRVFFGSISERLAHSGTFPLLLARPSDAWLEETEMHVELELE